MRKRPTQVRAQQTVGTILTAVMHILEREGAPRLTTNHIAERAGFSVGTVYQYFPDKRAILSALADHGQKIAQDDMLAAVRAAAPCNLETVARIIVRGTVQCNCAYRDKVKAMLLSRFDRREFEHVKERHDVFGDFVREVLAEFAPGEIRDLGPTGGYVLVSAMLGAIQCAFLADSPLPQSAEFEEELVRMFVAYVRRD